ncbi:MAG TPA: TIR domain-containing protein [Pyrinomonadaceae bacterium]|nr:TIR domain-containing protein [Pyrinomonadaceae bacterium]
MLLRLIARVIYTVVACLACSFFLVQGSGRAQVSASQRPDVLRLEASTHLINNCSGPQRSTQVQLKGSGTGPGKQLRSRWTVTGGRINGTGRDAVWDLDRASPGRYRATLIVESGGDCQPDCEARASTEVLVRGCPARAPVLCPSVSMCCPGAATTGQPVTFKITNTSGGTPGFKHASHWNISAGRIISGQGTYSIQVDTTGLGPQSLSASFESVGYGLKCNAVCSTDMHPPYPSTLRGSVNTGRDGRPLRGAQVIVSANDRTSILKTNGRGYYELAGLSPGTYRVEVKAQDFGPQIETVELAPAGSRDVNFFLSSLPTPPPAPSAPSPQPSPSTSARPSLSPSPEAEAIITATPSIRAVLQAPLNERSPAQTSITPYLLLIIFCILAALGSATMLKDKKKTLLGGDAPEDEVLSDEVTCTVFAPAEAPLGDCFLVQVFAHLPEHAELLTAKAQESDDTAKQRGSKKLETIIKRGQEMVFNLTMPGLEIDETSQALIWDGEVDTVQFAVTIPETGKTGNIIGTVTVCYQSVPIGHIKFKFKIAPGTQPQPQQVLPVTCAEAASLPQQNFVRYKQAFISYASQDRPEVLKRVQMLKMADIKFFQDLLTLEPGDNWEKTIYKYIDESDVMFLFWSSAAKQSAWVEKEVRYALNRKGGHDEAAPEILPVIIEGPPVVTPPDDLKMLHFNDTFMYFISADEATRPKANGGSGSV